MQTHQYFRRLRFWRLLPARIAYLLCLPAFVVFIGSADRSLVSHEIGGIGLLYVLVTILATWSIEVSRDRLITCPNCNSRKTVAAGIGTYQGSLCRVEEFLPPGNMAYPRRYCVGCRSFFSANLFVRYLLAQYESNRRFEDSIRSTRPHELPVSENPALRTIYGEEISLN